MQEEESKSLNRSRIDANNVEAAKRYQVRRDAAEKMGFYHLIVNHTGQRAVSNNAGVYWDCEANRSAILSYLEEQNQEPNTQSIEAAYVTLFNRGSLATYESTASGGEHEYTPATDSRTSRHAPQRKSSLLSIEKPVVVPYTKRELNEMIAKDMPAFKRLCLGGQEKLDAINAILNGAD